MCVTIGLNENLLNNQISTTMKKENILKWFYWKLVVQVCIEYFLLLFLILIGLVSAIVHFESFYPLVSFFIIVLFLASFLIYFREFKEKISTRKKNFLDLLMHKIEGKKEKYEKKKAQFFRFASLILFWTGERTYLYWEVDKDVKKYDAKISKCQDIINYIETERALSPRLYNVII